MKKVFIGIFIFVAFISAVPVIYAAEYMRSGDRVVLSKEEVVDHDYFAAGDSVILDGIVKGDAFLAGNNVVVDGTIDGDLLVAGRTVEINGIVTGDVRAAGEIVTIAGSIGRNLTVASSKVTIEDEAKMDGSIVAGAGEMTVAAPVGRSITAGVGSLAIENDVRGDINYWSDHDLALAPDASVGGRTIRHDVPKPEDHPARSAARTFVGFAIGFKILETLGLYVIGALLLRVVPLYMKSSSANMKNKTWQSLFVGFCTVIVLPVTALILLFTIIGIPIALFLIFAFIVVSILAKILAAYFLGDFILNLFTHSPDKYLALAFGMLVGVGLGFIPVLGWTAMIFLFLLALGGMLLHHREFYLSLRSKKLV